MTETTDRDEAQALLDEGKVALAHNELDKARALLEPLAEAGTPPGARFFLARCAFLQGEMDLARHWLSIVRERQPKHAGALVLEGRLAIADGDLAAADQAISSALGFNPELPAALNAQAELEAIKTQRAAAELIEVIDDGYLANRGAETPDPKLANAARKLAKLMPTPDWTSNAFQAKIAYFRHATDPVAALRNYDRHLIEVSCELDYITWPRRIQDYVQGKKVLDVGCGFGGYGTGFLVAGATAYAGLDPVMKLDSTRAKNKRTRTWSDMGVTPNQIMRDLSNVRLYEGTSESITFDETFDSVVMHNVTEHLIHLEEVFAGLVPLFEAHTRLVYLHHNFYCWNGHHFAPVRPEQIDLDVPLQRQVVDWGHILVAEDIPDDHYFNTHLNRVTLDEIKAITERHFEVETWDEINSGKSTLERLTPEVRQKVGAVRPELTDRDLLVNVVYCVAKRKS